MNAPAVTSGRVGREIVDRAYALAYFLHPDPDRALRLTSAALAKLKLAVRAQSRRIYYQPARADRRRSLRIRGRRTKVVLTDIQILQRLILVESERFERELEADRRATFEDSLIWFVKHVVRIVLKRNSLHTCVAISRLLHDYPTAEAQDIYGALIQDPDRVPDDAYFRSVKRRLLQELTERFAERIRVVTVERGEMRLESLESAGAWSEYLSETLVRCTPWETSCALRTKGIGCASTPSRRSAVRVDIRMMSTESSCNGCTRWCIPAAGDSYVTGWTSNHPIDTQACPGSQTSTQSPRH